MAALAACAAPARTQPVVPVAAPPSAPAPAPPPDVGPNAPTYGELMRGERSEHGPVAHIELRRWLRPLRTLDTSACRPSSDDVAAFYACWCRLVCGLRFERREGTTITSQPYNEAGGPGFEVAPDGHVVECWHSGRGAPETRVSCPAR